MTVLGWPAGKKCPSVELSPNVCRRARQSRGLRIPVLARERALKYDPFSNDECRSCIALPVCMGGCAHHAFDKLQYENRCGTFRHTYKERVLDFVEWAETNGTAELVPVVQLAQRLETR